MMRSLYSGVAGLKNHQTRMDVTGNNIANVNTNGYKAARTTFNDMFSQNVKGAASPRDNLGGTNPLQIGLGMNVASVDNIFTGGSLQATGKNTDLAIDGDGFFILQNGLERFYTRAGNFDFDALGNYVVPNTGLQVMGWLADENGVIQGAGDVGSLTYLTIPLDTPM
jgi:flagellar hook protein FlgE